MAQPARVGAVQDAATRTAARRRGLTAARPPRASSSESMRASLSALRSVRRRRSTESLIRRYDGAPSTPVLRVGAAGGGEYTGSMATVETSPHEDLLEELLAGVEAYKPDVD